MSGTEKAVLHVLDARGESTEEIPVQFNPTTMSLQMTNSIDGNKNSGRQARKYTGTSSATLSLDLEFDTADLGTNDQPVDVRDQTKKVAQFVLPGGSKAKQAPPRIKFEWGTFELAGVMSSLSEELSLFSPQGVPLRAKLSIQIKEQDPKYAALETGAGAGTGQGATAAGSGAAGNGGNDKAAEANDNETPADFLARNGLAPAAWRALGSALDALGDGIELPIGLGIEFPSSLSIGGGLGLSAGFQAELDVSMEASLGLDVGVGVSGRPAVPGGPTGEQATQGLTLAASGGLTAAAESAKQQNAASGAAAARSNFGQQQTSVPLPPDPGGGAAARAPLASLDSVRTLSPRPADPNPAPSKADPRATTYGLGVPLRDRVSASGSAAGGWVVIGKPSPTSAGSPAPGGRGRGAPWESLAPSAGRNAADREQSRRNPECGCVRCDPRSRRRYSS
ncbi:MAG: hypothetical protein OES24_02250 [Acidimicrobiia bacterium]|nr:hypothetical protein [Acidimicrobiia bacterium]